MSDDRQADLLVALQRPDAWPWTVEDVRLVETHISRVLIGGEHAVKLKRRVRYSFVDYGTLERRQRACQDEVRLNRRLSDDVYLGVVPILRDGAGYRIGTPGEQGDVVEWATLMRRIDEHTLLDHRLSEGAVPPDLANRLADRLVPFHRDRPAWGGDDPDAALDTLLAVVIENLDELQPFAGNPLPEGELRLVDEIMRGFIRDAAALFRQRLTGGMVCEGHGDLRCEHVIVPDEGPVQVYDCVEFNPDLRRADIASDLAFLLMDLTRLDAPPRVSAELVSRYRVAGIDLPVGLLRFYGIHRALVRAKVHCLRLADLVGGQRLEVVRKVVDYLHLAARQAMMMRPAMIAMTGLSGTGKSTVARALARATGAVFLDTDVIRKDAAYLAGDVATSRGEDIYSPEWTQQTYDRMIAEGSDVVRKGGVAILDGTFLDRALRDQAADAARNLDVPFVMVEVRCDDDVAFRRLGARERDPHSTSDAGVDIHLRQRERLRTDPPGIPEGTVHVTVDTSSDGPASLDSVLRAMIQAGVIEAGIRQDGSL